MIEIITLLQGGVGLAATIALGLGLLMVFASMMSSNPGQSETTGKAGCTLSLAALAALLVLIVLAVFS